MFPYFLLEYEKSNYVDMLRLLKQRDEKAIFYVLQKRVHSDFYKLFFGRLTYSGGTSPKIPNFEQSELAPIELQTF